jgi:hypothetical protein
MVAMKVYLVRSFSSVVEVDAATAEEAIEMASDVVDFSLCHQCNGHMEQDGEVKAMFVYDGQANVIWDGDSES